LMVVQPTIITFPRKRVAFLLPALQLTFSSIETGRNDLTFSQNRDISDGKCAMIVVHFYIDATPARSRPA
jgi:hypothetical protein